jgi:photosystem II stability/assembly factor-like uncharacterized protein
MSVRVRPSVFAARLLGLLAFPAMLVAPPPVGAQTANHEPDTPAHLLRGRQMDKESYMLHRATHIARLRGVEEGKDLDPALRQSALAVMQRQQARLAKGGGPIWTEIGPAPIPNGQTVTVTTPVSGRVISIAVHPSNPDIVYVGTASGGLYRSTNGGGSWTAMMDNAASLAIGSIAIAPNQPDTVYVGTGEPNFSSDSLFGVGLYRITGASTATPTIAGPFNQNGAAANVFGGRSIAAIRVHPTDPNTVFVATASGVSGIGGITSPTLPSRGVYRSTNATAAAPTFEKLTGLAGNANVAVRDIVIDPLNPNLLIAAVVAAPPSGGLYRSLDALAPNPVFTLEEFFNASSTSELTAELAIRHGAGDPEPVIYAATGNLGGRVLMSVNSGDTWTQQIDNNFCTPQCFYDIAIAVDPTDSTRVYLGGAPAVPFAVSTNSGTSFANSASGLHVDSHVIAVAPSNPSIVYFGSDGGIYRSNNSGSTWNVLNNGDFRATQFMSIATHPRDREFMIGGTQDNGTNHRQPDTDWLRVDFGDGGFAAIDQNAADTNNVRMYHTYFNAPTLMGYGTVSNVASATDGGWSFVGCQAASTTVNGITCTGSVLFYAPLALGPGSPNTVYYGTDRLYRSADNGTNHTVASQAPITASVAISAIAIAPNDDNLRIVGQTNGGVFRTLDGSATLADADAGGAIPAQYIGRILINPDDHNIVYVALAGYAGAGLNIWKSTNFLAAAPTWTAAATGIPNIPVSALAINPDDANHIFAGTDIGVYHSTDAGANWLPLGSGMPAVPVFGLSFNGPDNPGGKGPLRAATHGRGIWEIDIPNLVDLFADGFE